MPEPDHSTENTSREALFSSEGPEGPSLTHRAFVPMPPICSDSTLHSETVSHQSHTAGLMSPDHPSDEDAKSTESIFLTQVTAPICPSRSRSAHRFLQPLSNCTAVDSPGQAGNPEEVQLSGTSCPVHRQHLRSHWDLVLTSLQRLVTTCPSVPLC